MPFALVKLPGLDADRLAAIVEPVLRAHGVEGVELIWRSGGRGPVLEVTIERPGTTVPGQGVSVELCADISRDLSAALDVDDVVGGRYELLVGSPGIERALYVIDDYRRFVGQTARVRKQPTDAGQEIVEGKLQGVDPDGRVLVETERGVVALDWSDIRSASLVFQWERGEKRTPSRQGGGRKSGARAVERKG